jgi:hypothetical protein
MRRDRRAVESLIPAESPVSCSRRPARAALQGGTVMAMDRTGLVDEQALPFHIIATAVFVAALAVTAAPPRPTSRSHRSPQARPQSPRPSRPLPQPRTQPLGRPEPRPQPWQPRPTPGAASPRTGERRGLESPFPAAGSRPPNRWSSPLGRRCWQRPRRPPAGRWRPRSRCPAALLVLTTRAGRTPSRPRVTRAARSGRARSR